jgi:hypothetical protein
MLSSATSVVGTRERRAGVLALLMGMSVMAGLAGCDRKDATLNAVNVQARTLQTAGGAGEYSRQQYSSIATSLGEIPRNGERSGATASLMVSMSHLGLSDAEFQKYLSHETQSLAYGDQVRSALSLYLSLHQAADGADAFSVTAEMGRINGERSKNQELLVDAKAKKSAIDQQIATLRGDAKSRLDSAGTKLAQAADLTQGVAKMTSAEAASAREQAHEIKVQAESDRRAGLELEVRADLMQPTANEWALKITQYENLLKNLADSEASLQEQERLAKQSATDARADAQKFGMRIATLLGQMQELRVGPLDESATKTLSTLKKALDATREMAKPTGNPSQASLLVGMAQQGIGELHWARAGGHAAYAATLHNLIEAKPPLPAKSDYEAKAEAALKAHAESTDAAKAAFDDAQRGFDRAASAATGPAAAPAKAQLKALAARYQKLSGKAVDASQDAAAAEAAPAPVAAAPTPAPEAAPAAKEYDPALRKVLQDFIATAKSMKQLDDAMKAKFGKTMTEAAASLPGAGQMMGGMQTDPELASAMALLDVASLDVRVNGNSATITLPGSKSLVGRKMDGIWIVLEPAQAAMLDSPQFAGAAKIMPRMMAGMTAIANDLAAEVRNGQHANAEAAMQAFVMKFGAIMQQMMGGGG